ncbi:MAG TPA: aldo/keto reductase [Candidatus Acidoferrum sp.]|jgi:diketogulonate reductase-like aldo/keto reductase|nr:aldo/keto reductase [Candidatus Acidoferrum sp.]
MIEQLLSRRKFNRFCAALGSSLPAVSAIAALSSALETSEAIGAGSNGPTRAVRLRDGAIVPALGLGSARLAQGRHPEAIEEEALRTGLSLGMTLIDTAEVYSNGHSEELIGRVVAGQRDHVFLVSKVWPSHVAGDGIARACEASLARLGTDHLDLYLLHWPNGIIDDLSRIVAGFESLRAAGKIRAWGVSNFTVSDMENLFRVPHGDRCATNQVLYNISNRGIEDDLLPWCEKRGMPVMAYAPLGESSLVHDPTLARIGAAYGCSAAAVALAWAIRSGNVIAIPESGSPTHVKENAVALSLTLTQLDLQTLDAAYPPPRH